MQVLQPARARVLVPVLAQVLVLASVRVQVLQPVRAQVLVLASAQVQVLQPARARVLVLASAQVQVPVSAQAPADAPAWARVAHERPLCQRLGQSPCQSWRAAQRGLQPSPSPGSASLVLAEAQRHLRVMPR